MTLASWLRGFLGPHNPEPANREPDPYTPDWEYCTVQKALTTAAASLSGHGIDSAMRDARLLMAFVLEIEPSRITLVAQDGLRLEDYESFLKLVNDRCDHVPVSHILGFREFYGRRFKVSPHVLDPRPETETLIEIALSEPFEDVLDLGTGSGCILITLLAERPQAIAIGSDLSARALEVAEENAHLLGVNQRVGFLESHWFRGVGGRFDLIVSNPPYIALDEMPELAPDVRKYEPRLALTDEGDGLGAYRAIAAGLSDHLKPGGRVLLEIGPTQGAAVSGMLTAAGLENVDVLPDLDGRDRVVAACLPR